MIQNLLNLSMITLLMYSTTAISQTAGQPDELVGKLNTINQAMASINNSSVLTGPQEKLATSLKDNYDAIKTQINMLSNTLSTYEKINVPVELSWAPATNKNLFNASAGSDAVNICRAEFIGSAVYMKAIYPGQLTPSGCQISYAGYAILSTEYQVLAGKGDKTQWVPVAEISKLMEEKKSANLPPTSQIKQMPDAFAAVIIGQFQPTLVEFLSTQDPNGTTPLAISGGSESNLPVFICRATYEGKTKVGKLITYDAGAGTRKNACDISVGSKEVTVAANYELLVVKK